MLQIKNIQQAKKILRQANLDCLLWEEFEDSQSAFSEFVNSFTLNFIARNLPKEKFSEFQGKLSEDFWDFLRANIPDFDKRFSQELGEKILEIKNKVIKNQEEF